MTDAWFRFLDVGQGDSTVVVDRATGEAMVIDCPNWAVERVVEFLVDEDIGTIDTAVVTHFDLDHYGGMERLVSTMGCREVRYNHDTLFSSSIDDARKIRATLRAFGDLERRVGVLLEPATAWVSGQLGDIAWALLAPTHSEITQAIAAANRNLASAVMRLESQEVVVLLGGDAGGRTWRRLIDQGYNLNADILRAPHHGAKPSGPEPSVLAEEIMESVKPSLAVFSVGATNSYGHPSPEFLAAARVVDARIACTQVNRGCLGHALGADVGTAEVLQAQPAEPYCAGDVNIVVRSDGWTVSPSPAEHDIRIMEWARPLCRAGLISGTQA